ncbi:MAG: PAS domain S-box protein [Bacteroidales bacterium]|nr:PAS domain S-box protein [Bacteroidales bacterium]
MFSKFKENNDAFFTAFHINPAMSGLTNIKTCKFIDINKSACEKLAYSREEIIGKKADSINIVDKTVQKEIVNLINQKKKIQNYETIFKTKNGEKLHVLLSATILKGFEDYLYIVASDISDWKKAEQALKESEERYQSLSDATNEAILLSYKGQCFNQNKSAEKLFGYTLDEAVGKQISEWVTPKYHELTISNILSNYEKSYEVTAVRKDGSTFPAEIQIKKAFFKGKEIRITALRDISQKKKVEDELKLAKEKAETASRAKSEFLANISHEIRTPMNSILGFSELLLNKINNPQYKSYLSSILTSGKSLISLINNILDISKLEANKLEIKKEPVIIKTIFEKIEKDFQQKIDNKNLKFLIKIPDDLPAKLLLDETRVHQILYNLVSNAIKFTPKGYILLQSKIIQKKANNKIDLIFIVEDTGIGIPQKQRSLIFDTFIQQGRKYEGSGLGLSIAKRLTEKMNGEINLSSVVGKGTVFTVLFHDIETVNHQIEHKYIKPSAAISTCTKPLRIIIVDNYLHNKNSLKHQINNKNIHTLIIDRVEKILKIQNIEFSDIIFLNIDMFNKKGYRIIEKFKSAPIFKNTPLIAYSPNASVKSFKKNKHLFNGYINKPINKELIYLELKKHFRFSKITETKKEIGQKLSDAEKQKIDVFIKQHKLSLLQQWKNINDSLIIYEIENFVYNVIKHSNKLNVDILDNYLDNLLTKIHEFDIEAIEDILNKFPEIINSLESINH